MLTVSLDIEGIEQAREGLEAISVRLKDLSPAMRSVGNYVVSSAVRRIRANVPPPNAPITQRVKQGKGTLRDTGHLMASLQSPDAITARPDEVIVASDRPYARLQQKGGIIRPKKAKMLAVPLSAKTRTLMRRYGAAPRAAIEGMKADGWRIWTRQVKGKGDEAVVYAKRPKGYKIYRLFLLKKSATIPKRPFLYVDERDRKEIVSIIRRFISGMEPVL